MAVYPMWWVSPGRLVCGLPSAPVAHGLVLPPPRVEQEEDLKWVEENIPSSGAAADYKFTSFPMDSDEVGQRVRRQRCGCAVLTAVPLGTGTHEYARGTFKNGLRYRCLE